MTKQTSKPLPTTTIANNHGTQVSTITNSKTGEVTEVPFEGVAPAKLHPSDPAKIIGKTAAEKANTVTKPASHVTVQTVERPANNYGSGYGHMGQHWDNYDAELSWYQRNGWKAKDVTPKGPTIRGIQTSEHVIMLDEGGTPILEADQDPKDFAGPYMVNPILAALLSRATPHGTEKERIEPTLRKAMKKGLTKDKVGNLYCRIGDKPTTMFSCHMDTVHHRSDPAEVHLCITKEVEITAGEPFDYMVFGMQKNKKGELEPSVLGADDKLGMYIMITLANAGVPGLYVFHVGEEVGGIGSTHIASNSPGLVKGINRCIAFDRKDYGHIITNQSGGTCCSDEFADALAADISSNLPYKQSDKYAFGPNTGGTFTDSANYIELISECTNLSVGYFRQHSEQEHFDNLWLEQCLIPALLKVEWEKLPVVRDPTVRAARWRDRQYTAPKGTTSTIVKPVSQFLVDILGNRLFKDMDTPWTDANTLQFADWHDVNGSKLTDVTLHTPFNRIPVFDPALAIPITATVMQLSRMMTKTLGIGRFTTVSLGRMFGLLIQSNLKWQAEAARLLALNTSLEKDLEGVTDDLAVYEQLFGNEYESDDEGGHDVSLDADEFEPVEDKEVVVTKPAPSNVNKSKKKTAATRNPDKEAKAEGKPTSAIGESREAIQQPQDLTGVSNYMRH